MTLDINRSGVRSFSTPHPNLAERTSITGARLYPQVPRSADRYLGPQRGVP